MKDKILFPEAAASTEQDGYAKLNSEASRIRPGSDGLIFTPWINGVLAPAEAPYTRSAFFNQSAGTTRGHYARAVMEGVAYNLRWLKGHVERFIGRRFERLNFIGGGATSETWCQIQADVLGCPVGQVANARHAGAMGAAFAAFAALGEITLEQIPAMVKIARVFVPDKSAGRVYDRQFPEFLEFYRRMKPIYRRLNSVPVRDEYRG